MAAVLPRMKPAFKVAASRASRGRNGLGRPEYDPDPNPWEKYRLKLLPKRINGRWYKAGSWVYRRWMPSPGGGYWKYGDDFDYMRGK
jgi:hypothetical protein